MFSAQKKILHCINLLLLSAFFPAIFPASQAVAASIVNLDEVPQVLQVEAGGAVLKVRLMPYAKWESSAYPIRVHYEDDFVTPPLDVNGDYAIWPGGEMSLQRKGDLGRKH